MSDETTFKHLLPDGTELTITIKPPAPIEPPVVPVSKLRLGLTYDPKDIRKGALTDFPHSHTCRVFSPTAPPLWDYQPITALIAANIVPFVSWKDETPTKVNSWLDAMPPADVVSMVYATWMHEPEPKDVDPSFYKSTFKMLYELVKTHPNGNRVLFGPVLTRQWTENTSGRTYKLYDPGVGDFIGCDMYANTWDKDYPDPVEFVRYWGKYCADNANGRKVFVPEFGATLKPDDLGDRRARWLKAVIAEFMRWGVEVAVWWNDLGTPGPNGEVRDFRLRDDHGLSALSAAMAVLNA